MKRKAATKKKTAVLRKPVTRAGISLTSGETNSTPPHEQGFREVLALIERARARAYQAVNTELIDLYWRVGEFISRKIADDGWGKNTVGDLSTFIRARRPGVSGFSASNLWRMRQFHDTYAGQPKLAALLRELNWTQNLLILSLADCRKLLAAARDFKDGMLLPYTVLSLFAGLRPAEVARLTWDRIDLVEGTVTLDGSMAKTRQRRIVKLPENAVAWLLPLAPKRPEFITATFARQFGRVKYAAGFHGKDAAKTEDGQKLRPWVQDYMRHTAISMYLATHKHEGEAASWAGNSPNVIHRHYKGLVKEADATEFSTITPETVKGEVVNFPAKAAARYSPAEVVKTEKTVISAETTVKASVVADSKCKFGSG